MSNQSVRPRGRPLDDKLTEHVLDAALEILGQDGFKALTLEGVARRAGVSRTAIYKRWPGLPDLLLDVAVRTLPKPGTGEQGMSMPDTGSLAGDMAAFVLQGVEVLASMEEVGVTLPLLAESILSPTLGHRVRERLFQGDASVFMAILERAVERGEVGEIGRASAEVMFHSLIGYALFRRYIHHIGLDEQGLKTLCELMVAGLRAEGARPTAT